MTLPTILLHTGEDWLRHECHMLTRRLDYKTDRKAILADVIAWHADIEAREGKQHADTCLAVACAHYVEAYQNATKR